MGNFNDFPVELHERSQITPKMGESFTILNVPCGWIYEFETAKCDEQGRVVAYTTDRIFVPHPGVR